jgi:hypothetical protein
MMRRTALLGAAAALLPPAGALLPAIAVVILIPGSLRTVSLAYGAERPAPAWRALEPGLELKRFPSGPGGDSALVILRIDPRRWDLEVAGISQSGAPGGMTARQWSVSRGYSAVINAGMFHQDARRHVGYLEFDGHVNSAEINGYKSAAAFHARDSVAPFRIFDLLSPADEIPALRDDYFVVVQNLRLIRRPGVNCWAQQERRWSEAALGEDERGRVLFIFCRAALTMRDLNERLLALGIGVVAAQHLEGGPEAQLYIRAGGFESEMTGSFETGFNESDGNTAAWPLPNVIGIRARDRE